MATERQVIGQAQRILVDATNNIWHKISLWTHASDVEMPNGDPLNEFLTDMNDDLNEKIDGKYNSYITETTGITSLSQIPEIGYSRIQTINSITAGDYTIPGNHYCYCYSGKDPNSIEKMAVMIDTTDLTNIVMYIAHYSIEARWTLTKIATQKQIDDLQNQINDLNSAFNNLTLFVETSIGGLNARYQIIQDQMDWLEAELEDLQEQVNDLLNELRDFKKEINGRVNDLVEIFRHLYAPVGSIFITTAQMSYDNRIYPVVLSEMFGGTWKLVQGAYLYGAGYTLDYETNVSRASEENSRKYSRSELGTNYEAMEFVGADRDFSQIFKGRDEFVLDKENLPKHSHKVADAAEHGRVVTNYYQTKSDYHDYQPGGVGWADMSFAPSEDSSPYFVTAFNKNCVVTIGPNAQTLGKSYVEPDVGSNEYPGEPLFVPIELNPTRFMVYIWAKVAA